MNLSKVGANLSVGNRGAQWLARAVSRLIGLQALAGSTTHHDTYRFLPFRGIVAGIIFIGCRFILAPSTAAAGYGVSVAEPRAYLFTKGIRDIASGLFIAMLIAYGSAYGFFHANRHPHPN